MSDQTIHGFIAIAADQIGADGKQWIEVLPAADKVRNGPWYMTITRDDLGVWAEYIKQNPDKIPVDYDHAGDKQDGSTVAAGWFTGQAEVRDTADGPRLYAEVEWTPQAQEEIRSRRYRFISAVMSFANKDPKTGLLTRAKELIAATLTNRPFFRQLAPVARDLFDSDDLDAAARDFGDDAVILAVAGLSGNDEQRAAAQRVLAAVWTTAYINDLPDSCFLYIESGGSKDGGGKTTPRSLRHFPVKDDQGNIDMPHLRNALSQIPKSNLPASVKDRLTRMAQQMLSKAGGMPAATEGEIMELKVFATTLGLAEDADEESILAELKKRTDENAALAAKVADLEAKADVSDDLKRMATEGAQALKELNTMKVDQLITTAVACGKIPPVAKDAYATMAASDFDGTKALIDAMPDKSFKETGDGGDGDDGDEGDKPDEKTRARFTSDTIEPDDESLTLHVRAEKILSETVKGRPYTADEYAAAVGQASRTTA